MQSRRQDIVRLPNDHEVILELVQPIRLQQYHQDHIDLKPSAAL